MSKRIFEIDVPDEIVELFKPRFQPVPSCEIGLSEDSIREINPAATEWFPIEQAPKVPGTALLLGWWVGREWVYVRGNWDSYGWNAADEYDDYVHPTHFALVNPPKERK